MKTSMLKFILNKLRETKIPLHYNGREKNYKKRCYVILSVFFIIIPINIKVDTIIFLINFFNVTPKLVLHEHYRVKIMYENIIV